MALSLPAAAAPEPSPGGAQAAPGAFATAFAGARRQWALAGFVGLILGGGAAATYYTQTPQKYTVSASLQISPVDPILRENDNPTRDVEYRRAQAVLVRTRPVVLKALENKKVAELPLLQNRPDPAGWLEGALQAAVLEGGVLRVSLTGENPEDLASALNAVTAAYLEVIVGAEADQRRGSLQEMDDLLVKAEDRIRKLKNDERAMADTLRIGETAAGGLKNQAVLQLYANVLRDQLAVEGQLRTARAFHELLKAQAAAPKDQPVPENVLAEALAAEPQAKATAAEIARLREQLASGETKPGSATHARATADLKAAEDRLAATKADRREPVTKELRERRDRELATRVKDSDEKIRLLEQQLAGLKKEVELAKNEAEKQGSGSFELELKRAEIAEAQALMGRLRAKKEWLALEILTYKRRVNPSSPAEAGSARPAASAVTASAGLGAVGFALGALGVGYLESRRRRLVHSRDVAQVMRLRVLGNLPLVPGLADGPLLGVWGDRFGRAGAHLVEAVNDLRAMLLSGGEQRPPQVVMVTSAGQGEGKTTLACLLALSLAQIGKRTLLVDGDLRNPQVPDRLGLPSAAGLGEVLRGEARPGGVIGGVPGTPLAVMTAGRPCPSIIRGLSADRIEPVLAELRKQFDYIVVDSCPTPLTDGLVIGACVDAAVLVVRSGHSAEPLVRAACERLLAGQVPLVGGVMNGLSLRLQGLRYPYAALPPAQGTEPAPSVGSGAGGPTTI